MNVEVETGEHRIVRAFGEIDLSNVGLLKDALDRSVDESPEGFVIDLSGAGYIDSAGIQSLLSAYQRVRVRGGRLALVVGDAGMRDLIAVVHLDALPGMFVTQDLESALRAFDAWPQR